MAIVEIDDSERILDTPLGKIEILVDGESIDYEVKTIEVDSRCKELNGRFLIEVNMCLDGKEHTLACIINNYVHSKKDEMEVGERLELKSFYAYNVKLSIGMEGESGYYTDGTRFSDSYDYDNEYLDNGVIYKIFPTTKTTTYRFGVAWLNNCTVSNEVQTWYGADPYFTKMLDNRDCEKMEKENL